MDSILFISLDATRFDALTSWDTAVDLSFFRSFEKNCHTFTNAYTCSPWTPPAHASMFTGLQPRDHLVREGSIWLSRDTPTLAGELSSLGYYCLGISSNPLLGPITNLNKDFHNFFELWKNPDKVQKHSQFLRFDDIILDSRRVILETERILKTERQRIDQQPLFLFIQLIGPHNPFTPSEAARNRYLSMHADKTWETVTQMNEDWRWHYGYERMLTSQQKSLLRELYTAEIWDLDQGLSHLFSQEILKPIIEKGHIIITADHGEMLGEKNHIHHLFNLYEPLIHIPFMWKTPRQDQPLLEDKQVQHTMIYPVLQKILSGMPFDEASHSFLGHAAIASLLEPVEILQGLEKVNPERCGPHQRHLAAYIHERKKTIYDSTGAIECYDLSADPLELNPVSVDPEMIEDVLKELEIHIKPGHPVMEQVLKDLGYY